MRTYSTHCIAYHAGRVQATALVVAAVLAFTWIALAIAGLERPAIAASILGAVAIGVSVGAWIVAERFRD